VKIKVKKGLSLISERTYKAQKDINGSTMCLLCNQPICPTCVDIDYVYEKERKELKEALKN